MNNKNYWANRVKIAQDKVLDRIYDEYILNMENQYTNAIIELEKDISVWYQRFADNNEIGLAEAKKLLKHGELEEFKWTVEQYIERGRENGISADWSKQLENASARVHISRLESLKYQLRQHIEELTEGKIKNTTEAAELAFTEAYYHTAFEFQKEIGVGFSLQMIDKRRIEKLLDKPWTADNQTFKANCWTDKEKLVEAVNRELTRMIAIGEPPKKAIENIAKQFETSKKNAGRLIMTESAYFATAAQKELYEDLGAEDYQVIENLDKKTCTPCGKMDSKVFPVSDMQAGVTAPPFHPWCRGTTVPYYEDMAGVGTRIARNPETGKTYNVPSDMTYEQWKKKQDELYGEGYIDKKRKIEYNKKADKKQYERYVKLLGNTAPKSFKDFQTVKYEGDYSALKTKYADAKIQHNIKNGKIPTNVLQGKQDKHIVGKNNYIKGRSYIYPDVDIQALVDKYAGTGKIKRDGNGNWTHKEFIKADRKIGVNITVDGVETETSEFAIHYSKKGVHVVPKKE